MSVFPDWQRHARPQRRWMTGCIPAGFEMILRAAGAQGVDLDAFQDDFDLDKDLQPGADPVNHFGSVAQAVKKKYPWVEFAYREFARGDGEGKLAFIEQQLAAKRPVLVSIANAAFGEAGWHIAPVVDADDQSLTLLWSMSQDGQASLLKLPKAVMVQIHDTFPGGVEVAYLRAVLSEV